MAIHIGGTGFERAPDANDATPLRILDDLSAILNLIDVAFAAAGTLNKEDGSPIQTALDLAEQFGRDLYERIDAAREQPEAAA